MDERDNSLTHCAYAGSRDHFTAPTAYFQTLLVDTKNITTHHLSGTLAPYLSTMSAEKRALYTTGLITQLTSKLGLANYDKLDCNYYYISDD